MSDIVKELHEYAKDWRDRAASKDIVDCAASRIEALESQLAEARARIKQQDIALGIAQDDRLDQHERANAAEDARDEAEAKVAALLEAATQVVADDCDWVIHPNCWERLRAAVSALQGANAGSPNRTNETDEDGR